MDLTATEILTPIATLLTGGGAVAIYNALKKNSRDDFSIILADYKEQKENGDKRLEEMISTINALRVALSTCEKANQTLMLTAVFGDQLPFPFWIKSPDGVMLYINKAYTKHFDVLPEDYVNKKDEEIWGKEIALNYQKGDAEAMKDENSIWIGDEIIIVHSNEDISAKWKIIKYSIWGGGALGNRICLANPGMAFPIL